MRCLVLVLAVGLGSCASQGSSSGGFVRADGQQADQAQARLAVAQCQGEAAMAVQARPAAAGPIPWAVGQAQRSSGETAVMNACMARNGYLSQ